MSEITEYEIERNKRIAANKEFLVQLDMRAAKTDFATACARPAQPRVHPRARKLQELAPSRR